MLTQIIEEQRIEVAWEYFLAVEKLKNRILENITLLELLSG